MLVREVPKISHRSVATRLRSGVTVDDDYFKLAAQSLENEFSKLVSISLSY